MNSKKTAIILGGGVGGLVTANILRKLLPRQHRVILIDREKDHLFLSSLLWLMIGKRKAENISRSLNLLSRKGIEVIQGEVDKIDPQTKKVVVSGREIAGDTIVISLGADLVFDAISGLKEAGHAICNLEGVQSISRDLCSFQGGRVAILTATTMYKCPAAPYEAAMLVECTFRQRGIRDKVQIDLYSAEPGPMGTAGPEISAAVRQMVESKGIRYHPNYQVTEVRAHEIKFSNGTSANFDLLLYVPPHRAPKVIKDCGLLADSGWIAVDRHTLETGYKGVYAIGDVVSIPLKMGKPLPKAGVFAHGQAKVVAHNIAHEWTGKGATQSFDGFGQCFIEVGDNRAGIGSGNFYCEPMPKVTVKPPALRWHVLKVLFEKYWLRRWFPWT